MQLLRRLLTWAGLSLALVGCGGSASPNLALPPDVPTITATEEFRAADGSTNSPQGYGRAGATLLRSAPAAYADGFQSPSGAGRLSPRAISNLCARQVSLEPDPVGRTNMTWAWGQFLDHDISHTTSGQEFFPIAVPLGDAEFDPRGTGSVILPFTRSIFDRLTGTEPGNPRNQRNLVTAYIDGSVIYGSEEIRADALRTFEGGRLATSPGQMPQLNTSGLPMDNSLNADPGTLFLSGDVRANEQVALTCLHALFIREHNWWAEQLTRSNPTWDDERLYQRARKLVGAEIQVITYQEFLPSLLGPEALPPFTGHQESVDAGIDVLFSSAAFRIGHTMVSPSIPRLSSDGSSIPAGPLDVRASFFQPQELLRNGGIDPILRGLASSSMQRVDSQIVDDLRNFLFGPPGSGGMDLASLNVQRGRDHGLCDFNTVREHYGLTRVANFAQISTNPQVRQNLSAAYASVDDIDPWIGFLAEDPMDGAAVGPTLRAVLIDQFVRLRDGDRFFYLNDPSLNEILPTLQRTRLSDIVQRNSGAQVQRDVFFLP